MNRIDSGNEDRHGNHSEQKPSEENESLDLLNVISQEDVNGVAGRPVYTFTTQSFLTCQLTVHNIEILFNVEGGPSGKNSSANMADLGDFGDTSLGGGRLVSRKDASASKDGGDGGGTSNSFFLLDDAAGSGMWNEDVVPPPFVFDRDVLRRRYHLYPSKIHHPLPSFCTLLLSE